MTLSEGGATVAYRVKDESLAFRYQEPPGPPYAPMSFRLPSVSR